MSSVDAGEVAVEIECTERAAMAFDCRIHAICRGFSEACREILGVVLRCLAYALGVRVFPTNARVGGHAV
jgi:hypothetical protein